MTPDEIAMERQLSRRAALFGGAALGLPLLAGLDGLPGTALAQSSVVDITKARTDPIPIAIPDFAGAGDGQRVGRDIARVVINNLKNSGLFRPVERAAFIQTPEAAGGAAALPGLGAIGAQALTTGRVDAGADRVRVEFRLWDVLPEQQIQGTAFTAAAGQLAPHRASDLGRDL